MKVSLRTLLVLGTAAALFALVAFRPWRGVSADSGVRGGDSFDLGRVDLGTLREDATREGVFRRTNDSGDRWSLSDVHASCGCLRVLSHTSEVPVGEDLVIRFSLRPAGRVGALHQSVSAIINETILVTGKIDAEVLRSPFLDVPCITLRPDDERLPEFRCSTLVIPDFQPETSISIWPAYDAIAIRLGDLKRGSGSSAEYPVHVRVFDNSRWSDMQWHFDLLIQDRLGTYSAHLLLASAMDGLRVTPRSLYLQSGVIAGRVLLCGKPVMRDEFHWHATPPGSASVELLEAEQSIRVTRTGDVSLPCFVTVESAEGTAEIPIYVLSPEDVEEIGG